ncbi:MAG: response regulator [Deltaproteobacteria bacterium]|nr:response regulator [Deltaproteobacteria bacterium]
MQHGEEKGGFKDRDFPSMHSGVVIPRQEAEDETLIIRNAYLEHLLESARDAIVWAESDHRVIRVNKAFSRLFQYATEEALGKYVDDLIAPEEFYDQAREITRRVSEGETVRSETMRCRKDHSPVLVDLLVAPIMIGDRQVGVCATYRDLAERKRAEENRRSLEKQLLQAQKMEAVGALAAGVAHDFNNVLMGVQGNASLVLADLDETHPHYERLSNIEHYVGRGADLAKQLLGLARGGHHEVKSANMNDLINRSANLFIRTKKELSLRVDYQEDLWFVQVDPGQIEQALLNLYINAWQSMPGGGTLAVFTKNVVLDEDMSCSLNLASGRYVKCSIVDTGIGMDKNTRERIFEPFFTTKKMGRGTGLGLASVYGIIRNHGGVIKVESQVGKGTEFSIYLPASEYSILQPKDHAPEASKGSGTILLVDDEEMILQISAEILERMGYRVLAADSGEKAVRLFKCYCGAIDLVILDMIMPEMSGAEVFHRLRKVNPHPKVLLSSGYSLEEQARELLREGCVGFIQKPYSMSELSEKVKDAIGKGQ